MRLTALFFLVLFQLIGTPVFSQEVLPASYLDLFMPKKEVPVKKLGINAFVNDPKFGSISSQFSEVNSVIRLKFVRVLFAWNDDVQPSPNSEPNFSFYDDIANKMPKGVKAVAVLTGVPSWMNNSNNWINGNPRTTFNKLWVEKVIKRYKKKRIAAYQIWNEPNTDVDPLNVLMGLSDSPENYVELLATSYNTIKSNAKSKRVVSAATTGISQNFPETLQYNIALRDAGIENFVDVFGVHFYGYQPETIIIPNGVADFLNSLSKPIWVTESGAKGTTKQLEYAKRLWPFLLDIVPGIKRIYCYQFTENSPASSTYGLKNPTPGKTVSDLYIYLRDR